MVINLLLFLLNLENQQIQLLLLLGDVDVFYRMEIKPQVINFIEVIDIYFCFEDVEVLYLIQHIVCEFKTFAHNFI